MCGRTALFLVKGIDYTDSYNISPTNSLPIFVYRKEKQTELLGNSELIEMVVFYSFRNGDSLLNR
jgi:hypothetical protein